MLIHRFGLAVEFQEKRGSPSLFCEIGLSRLEQSGGLSQMAPTRQKMVRRWKIKKGKRGEMGEKEKTPPFPFSERAGRFFCRAI